MTLRRHGEIAACDLYNNDRYLSLNNEHYLVNSAVNPM